MTRQKIEQTDTERKDIGFESIVLNFLLHSHFKGHKLHRAYFSFKLLVFFPLNRCGIKIDKFHSKIRIQDHIVRFQISMSDVISMQELQTFNDFMEAELGKLSLHWLVINLELE